MTDKQKTGEAVGHRLDRAVVPLLAERAGWTPHAGGPAPLPAGARFDSLHRDGSVSVNRTVYMEDRWDHYGTACDIVAYRRADGVDPRSLLPSERQCCGTFVGSPHRATCEHYKRHNV